MPQLEINIQSLDDLTAAAQTLLTTLGNRNKLAFTGEIGAGKTTFIKALCKILGVTTEVNSPTFSLINQYATASGDLIYHIDLYRLNTADEVWAIGLEDYLFSNNHCLIEWPEIIADDLPDDTVHIHLEAQLDESRQLSANWK